AAVQLPPARPRQPGVYRGGLVVLLDASFDASCFESWPSFAGGRFSPFAYTALGDFFLWDRDLRAAQYLEVQRDELTKVDAGVDELLDELLPRPEMQEELLLAGHVADIVRLRGPLHYGEAFILEP